MQDAYVEQSTPQLIMDQIEELVVTLIEEIRERPGVALAIVAGIAGAFVGVRLAARSASKTRHGRLSAPKRPAAVRRAGHGMELAGLGLRFLRNPVARGFVLLMLERQFKRRMGI
ncbi:MAG TPA: hypothetical protein VF937_13030 [Chloroflexota bacterium]